MANKLLENIWERRHEMKTYSCFESDEPSSHTQGLLAPFVDNPTQ